jgi:uncharacterized SAM-binding protein YcdF (DUF218 family)
MTANAIATFLLVPPVNLLLLALAGLVLRQYRAGRILCGVGLTGLLLLALPLTSHMLMLGTEDFAAPSAGAPAPSAIVILGGDESRIGSTPAAIDVGAQSLERLRAGAVLQRATRLPVLVSGGVTGPGQPPLASAMAHSLEADFAVPVRWRESASRDTWENARDSAAILHAAGIDSVFLVTHAWHMRRALIAFRRFGLEARPVPVPFSRLLHIDLGSFVPRAASWVDSYQALHEWVGCAWYALRARW